MRATRSATAKAANSAAPNDAINQIKDLANSLEKEDIASSSEQCQKSIRTILDKVSGGDVVGLLHKILERQEVEVLVQRLKDEDVIHLDSFNEENADGNARG